MSTEAMAYVWDHSKHAGTALLVLLSLADNADMNHEVHVPADIIARRARIKRITLGRFIDYLAQAGELRRLPQHHLFDIHVRLEAPE